MSKSVGFLYSHLVSGFDFKAKPKNKKKNIRIIWNWQNNNKVFVLFFCHCLFYKESFRFLLFNSYSFFFFFLAGWLVCVSLEIYMENQTVQRIFTALVLFFFCWYCCSIQWKWYVLRDRKRLSENECQNFKYYFYPQAWIKLRVTDIETRTDCRKTIESLAQFNKTGCFWREYWIFAFSRFIYSKRFGKKNKRFSNIFQIISKLNVKKNCRS